MTWLRCSACKRDINHGALHWVCNVSTCNRHNTNYKFCSVACWDSHVATLRHRDSWAVEARAPQPGAADRAPAPPRPTPTPPTSNPPAPSSTAPTAPTVRPSGAEPARRMVAPPAPVATAPAAPTLATAEAEILIVVSKLKKYIRDRSGMNTSDSVVDVLSEHVRAICDDAIRTAATDGRKTVLDRDVPKVRR
ncbi:MAG: hypothetical protein IPL61_04135 [Myxococcales bacterium]|nr:hypothetical protein [Myxococcales bacterium]